MPNPGKSLAQLKRSGTFRKHSGRYLARVQAVEAFKPLGGPPKHLGKAERAAWNEIRRRAAYGTLADSDFVIVELASRLLVKSRSDPANFSATDSRVLQSLANDLGMSPTKRGRISPAEAPQEGDGKWAEVAAMMNRPHQPN